MKRFFFRSISLAVAASLLLTLTALAAAAPVTTYALTAAGPDGAVSEPASGANYQNRISVNPGDTVTVTVTLTVSSDTDVPMRGGGVYLYYDEDFFDRTSYSTSDGVEFQMYNDVALDNAHGKGANYFKASDGRRVSLSSGAEVLTLTLKVKDTRTLGESSVVDVCHPVYVEGNPGGGNTMSVYRYGTSLADVVTGTSRFENLLVQLGEPAARHTVTYLKSDGTPDFTAEADDGASIRLAVPAEARPRYTFVGWKAPGESTAREAGSNFPVTADTALTPVWTAHTQAAPVVSGADASAPGASDGALRGTTSAMRYAKDESVDTDDPNAGAPCGDGTTAGLPAGTYYVWYPGTEDKFPSPKAMVVVGSAAAQQRLRVRHVVEGGEGIISPAAETTVAPGGEDQYYVQADPGWHIKSLTQGNSLVRDAAGQTRYPVSGGSKKWRPSADATVSVLFERDDGAYTVTWKDGDTVLETDENVPAGTKPEFNGTVPAREGMTFTGWNTAPGASSGIPADRLPSLSESVTYYAVFQSGSSGGGTATPTDGYTVHLVSADGGSMTISPAARVPAGTRMTLTITPDEGKALTRLTLTKADGTVTTARLNVGGVYIFAMPSGDVTVRATFATKVASPDDTGVSGLLNTDDHIWYLRGYVEGDIRPLGNMTRAEAAQAFYRLLRRPEVTLTKSFPDVPDGAWYAKAVRTLASMGIINGGIDGNFYPNEPITRAEFAAIATRFAKATGGTATFLDVPENHWARSNIATAAAYGWINGFGDGNFGPANNITRAEVATIVNHMLGRAADQSYVTAHKGELNQFSDLQDAAQWYYFDMVESSNAHLYDRNSGSETWTKLTGDELKD